MVKWKFVLALFLAVGTAGCAAQHSGNTAELEGSTIARASYFITIALDKPAYFATADGGPLLAPAGQYAVGSADESHRRLTFETSAAPFVIAAVLQTRDIICTNRCYILQARTEVARFDDGIGTLDIGPQGLEYVLSVMANIESNDNAHAQAIS